MAKIYGLFGSMTGKLADVVMSVRNGEQIARKYQPVVLNPSTPAQVAQRAKLKLLSQVSAVMAPVIAMRREGPVSSRNQFVRANFPAASYNNNQADITLTSIKLTKSVVSLPAISATREGTTLSVQLTQGAGDFNHVVYVAFGKQNDGTLRFADSAVINNAGSIAHWEGSLTVPNVEAVVYAYAVRDNNENARAKFGDLQVVTAETIAKLLVSRTLSETDVTLTETRAVEVPAAQ